MTSAVAAGASRSAATTTKVSPNAMSGWIARWPRCTSRAVRAARRSLASDASASLVPVSHSAAIAQAMRFGDDAPNGSGSFCISASTWMATCLRHCKFAASATAILSNGSPCGRATTRFMAAQGPTALAVEITQTTWTRFLDPDEPMHALVAESAGRLVGLAHYLFHRSTVMLAPTCYLQDLFTVVAQRGHGIGGRLIEAVYDRARAAGAGESTGTRITPIRPRAGFTTSWPRTPLHRLPQAGSIRICCPGSAIVCMKDVNAGLRYIFSRAPWAVVGPDPDMERGSARPGKACSPG